MKKTLKLVCLTFILTILSNSSYAKASVRFDFLENFDEEVRSIVNMKKYIDFNGIFNNRDELQSTKIIPTEKNTKIKEKIEPIQYDPNDLREPSNLTAWQIEKILEGSNLQVLAEEYYEMEQKYNINALFLIALNTEESGYGRSDLAVYRNNIGGVRARSGGFAHFESWESCLDYIANLIDKKYLTESGPYYNGTSIYDVNKKYCVGEQWAINLNKIANKYLAKVGTTP